MANLFGLLSFKKGSILLLIASGSFLVISSPVFDGLQSNLPASLRTTSSSYVFFTLYAFTILSLLVAEIHHIIQRRRFKLSQQLNEKSEETYRSGPLLKYSLIYIGFYTLVPYGVSILIHEIILYAKSSAIILSFLDIGINWVFAFFLSFILCTLITKKHHPISRNGLFKFFKVMTIVILIEALVKFIYFFVITTHPHTIPGEVLFSIVTVSIVDMLITMGISYLGYKVALNGSNVMNPPTY